MAKSALGPRVSVSVALLLPGVGSVTPAGAATEAVLVSDPVAAGSMFPVRVYVAVPPTGRWSVVLMLPVPLAAPQLEPADATHAQVAPVRAAGTVSVTPAPMTELGPLLVTMIVYVSGVPGTA